MGSTLPPEFRGNLIDTLVWLTRDRKEWLAGRVMIVNLDVEELEGKKEEVVKGDKLKVRLVV